MYWLNIDEGGYVLSVAQTPIEGPCIESLDGLDLSGHRIGAHRWDGEKLVLDEDKLAALDAEAAAREQADQIDEQIAELKERLTSTDYAVIKIAEGAATVEEYADVIAQRKLWRDEINRLEVTA